MKADFGTYHHSTPVSSRKIRTVSKAMFVKAFELLPFSIDDKLKILDVGCGLGFLSCVSAEFYKNARITGIDTFEDDSIKDSSIKKAKENTKILGFSGRIDFKSADLLKFNPVKRFDIIISNLVFHNLGKMRFKAYSRLLPWMKDDSYIVVGDIFFTPKKDLDKLQKMFKILSKSKPEIVTNQYTVIVMSKKS